MTTLLYFQNLARLIKFNKKAWKFDNSIGYSKQWLMSMESYNFKMNSWNGYNRIEGS